MLDLKEAQMFQFDAQKVAVVVYTFKGCFLKIAQKVTTYLGDFYEIQSPRTFKKLPNLVT